MRKDEAGFDSPYIMNTVLQKTQDAVRAFLLKEGANDTGVPSVKAWLFRNRTIQMPETENPYIYIVLDGILRLYTPSGIMDYTAGQYSVSQIDTPLSGTVLTFSGHRDFSALSVEFTSCDVISSVLELDNGLTQRIMSGNMTEQEITSSDCAVTETVYRLLSAMKHTVSSDFLRKSIMREVIYHILCGSCGKQLIQSIANVGTADVIYEANSWIKENFRSPFTVKELAGQSNMSVSLFHQKFKSAVGMGPLQCQKRLRLTEAKRLMLDEEKNVTEASAEVGYESLSQFIRDYRKMFGASPKEDIRSIKE